MGEIRVHEFMSLDGVVENPAWTFEFGFDPRMGQAIAAAMAGCEAILLGRATFEMFEPAWSARSAEDDPGAPFMNDTPKYVVSSTLQAPTWKHSTALGAYDAEALRKLKASVDGGIYVSGSLSLVRSMVADGLVDDLHLFVYPVTLGEGRRLFTPELPRSTWTLAATERYDNGVLYLHYQAHAS